MLSAGHDVSHGALSELERLARLEPHVNESLRLLIDEQAKLTASVSDLSWPSASRRAMQEAMAALDVSKRFNFPEFNIPTFNIPNLVPESVTRIVEAMEPQRRLIDATKLIPDTKAFAIPDSIRRLAALERAVAPSSAYLEAIQGAERAKALFGLPMADLEERSVTIPPPLPAIRNPAIETNKKLDAVVQQSKAMNDGIRELGGTVSSLMKLQADTQIQSSEATRKAERSTRIAIWVAVVSTLATVASVVLAAAQLWVQESENATQAILARKVEFLEASLGAVQAENEKLKQEVQRPSKKPNAR